MTLTDVLAGLQQARYVLTRLHQHQAAAAVQSAHDRLSSEIKTTQKEQV